MKILFAIGWILAALAVNVAAAQEPKKIDKYNFEDEPDIIFGGPDVGIPSPQGNCIGSGCSTKPDGPGFGANAPGRNGKPQFPSRQAGDTEFRIGSLEFGPSWSNGGYLNGGIDPIKVDDIDPFRRERQSQYRAVTSVTADNVFPRQQIYSDFGYLRRLLDGMSRGKLLSKYPRVLAPLPPSVAQFVKLSDDIFDQNIAPIVGAPNFDYWRTNLRSKTVPVLIDNSWQRDLALNDAYLAEIKDLVGEQAYVVAAKTKDLLGNATVPQPPLLYRHPLRSGGLRWFENSTNAELLSSQKISPNFEARHSGELLRDKNEELIRRSAGIIPPLPQGGIARMLANLAIIEADHAFTNDEVAEALLMQQFASSLLEISVSALPVAGQMVAIYEYISGRSFSNGEEISAEQRTIMGAMLAGTFLRASAPAVLKGLNRLRTEADTLNAAAADVVGAAIRANKAGNSSEKFRFVEPPEFTEITGIRQGGEVNADAAIARGKRLSSDRRPWATDIIDYQPAWQSSELVVEGKTATPTRLVRLHTDSSRNGTWLAPEAEVGTLTGRELKNRFNIPSEPTMRTDITLPAGTPIRYGRVGKNAFGVSQGARQIEVAPGTLQEGWFGPSVPINK